MAAKNKFKGREAAAVSPEDADLHDLLGLHFQACRRAEEVEEQIQELQAAGKYPEARVLRMQSLGIQQGLRAIEADVRKVIRPGRKPSASIQQRVAPLGTLPPGASMLSRSPGPDFETAMDSGVTLEITR